MSNIKVLSHMDQKPLTTQSPVKFYRRQTWELHRIAKSQKLEKSMNKLHPSYPSPSPYTHPEGIKMVIFIKFNNLSSFFPEMAIMTMFWGIVK